MNKYTKLLTVLILLFSFNLFAAASDDVKTSSDDFETTIFEDEIYDPLEGINRAVFGFNNVADRVLRYFSQNWPKNAYATNQGEAWAIPVRTAANAVDQRSQIIDEVNALRDNSVDYYAAVRSSYYQNRKAAIMNTDDDVLTPLPLISIEFE